MEDTVEIPRLADRGDIVDTCPLCGKWSRSENLCPQNPHIPMFVTAPVFESLPVVAEQVQPALVVEYVTPARTVTCAAPATTITVTSTVFPTATVLLANCAEARGDPTGADLGQVVDLPVVVVVVRRQVPMVLAVHRLVVVMDLSMLKTFQVRQLQFIDKFVVSQTRLSLSLLCWSCWFHRCRSWRRQLATHCYGVDVLVLQTVLDPRVQSVEKTVVIPHLQIIKKVVEIPEIQTVQGTQTPESFGFCTCPPGGTGGTVEVVEIGTLLPAESAPPTRHPSLQTSESLGTAPVRLVAQAEIFGDGRDRSASSCKVSRSVSVCLQSPRHSFLSRHPSSERRQ